MSRFPKTATTSAIASFVLLGAMSAAMPAQDLSKYRNFQLGADLAAVARQAGMDPSEAKAVHRRPVLIQELDWRPQPIGAASQNEVVKEVNLSFYDGELFRFVVNYDRYETEGLTADDFVEAISAAYGTAGKPVATVDTAPVVYGDREETIAQWQDSRYRFELIRSSFGPSFRLVGVTRKLEAPAQAAILEATRLEANEAPQREADRAAKADETERTRLEAARLAKNKAKFRP
jgi:hypothetical protein